MNTKVYVGNLSHLTTSEDLRMLFSRAGSVVSVDVVKDQKTGRSRGFAFVEMVSQSDAGKAVSEFNGYLLDRRRLAVKAARSQGQKPKHAGALKEYTSYHEISNRGY
ncbi:MAG TPA: RNA-binding protein [Anaerolineaceae bacterium]|nr:RNA-binding protein [Anaerolineaceae bacterium]